MERINWRPAAKQSMFERGISMQNLADHLGVTRARIEQMLKVASAREENDLRNQTRIEAAIAWCVENRVGNKLRPGMVVNGCVTVSPLGGKRGWVMVCETCGEEIIANTQAIRNGRAHCKKCTKWVSRDITGQRFGSWTVLGLAPDKKIAMWACRCDCGTFRAIRESNLTRGMTTGCSHCMDSAGRRSHKTKRNVLVPLWNDDDCGPGW